MSDRNDRIRRLLVTIVFCGIASMLVSACTVSSDYLPRFTMQIDPPLKSFFSTEQKVVQ